MAWRIPAQWRCCLLAALLAAGLAGGADAQITSLADDIILITKGVSNQEQVRNDEILGAEIGGTANSLGYSPGSPAFRNTARFSGSGLNKGYPAMGVNVLGAAADELPAPRVGGAHSSNTPERLPAPASRFLGDLEIPETEDEGPANGLTLDTAIARTVRQNHELRSKWYEIPQARADVLTASLRANPLVFGTVGGIPYQSYSAQRPGNLTYSGTVIYPLDVSHKRRARTQVANQAKAVIEAQYQDAVRIEIDRLYIAYVEVVAARESLRYAKASRDGLEKIVELAERQMQGQQIGRPEYDRVAIQLDSAEIGVEQAEVALRESKHTLGLVMGMPLEDSEKLEVRGSMRDNAPPPPDDDELRAIACQMRSDLLAYRLGIHRAQADVKLAQAEATADVFVLYTPWELQNNTPLGTQNSQSWSAAVFGSVPLFNRNQGNIRRAELNVSQTRAELTQIEQQVIEEVHSAAVEYRASLEVVERLERSVLPRSRRIRDASGRLLEQGQISTLEYLAALRDHNDIVRQYRDALIRHRRSMLKLNTAVGERILP